MNKIYIEPDKHLCIIFQPRSGSHVLRYYLATLLDRVNLGEYFNPENDSFKISDDGIILNPDQKSMKPVENKLTMEEITKQTIDHVSKLKILSEKNTLTVFSMVPHSYNLDLMRVIQQQSNVQFIRLQRADLLTAILSAQLSTIDGVWHNQTDSAVSRDRKKLKVDLNGFCKLLESHINVKKNVEDVFPKISDSTVYYEQFQMRVPNIINMFTGIPKEILSVPHNKFLVNYKDLIIDLEEVEDLYAEFVNKHKEHFPQYFEKLPGVIIPASQGKQPKELINR